MFGEASEANSSILLDVLAKSSFTTGIFLTDKMRTGHNFTHYKNLKLQVLVQILCFTAR